MENKREKAKRNPNQQLSESIAHNPFVDATSLVNPEVREANVIRNADEEMEEQQVEAGVGNPLASVEEEKEPPLSLGQRIAKAGKRMQEPKLTISFKEAVERFKSKEELYFTLTVRGRWEEQRGRKEALPTAEQSPSS